MEPTFKGRVTPGKEEVSSNRLCDSSHGEGQGPKPRVVTPQRTKYRRNTRRLLGLQWKREYIEEFRPMNK